MPSKIQDIVSLEEETLIGQWISLRCNFLVDVEGASSWWVDEQAWWYTPLIPALENEGEISEFKTSLAYTTNFRAARKQIYHQTTTAQVPQWATIACLLSGGLTD